MARIARWSRPLESRWARAGAWWDMLVSDHGVFRLLYPNRSPVTARLWRSSQPSPGQVAWFARAGGRTVVNLRGGREHGAWPLERDACARHGLQLVDITLRSREAPDPDTIVRLASLLETMEYPALVHCKSGADRAGLFSALFLILQEGRTAAEAERQLSLRFGHFRYAKTGILDAFLQAYREGGEAKGRSLLDWVTTDYDPAALTRGFQTRLWSTLLADRIVRRE